MAYDGLIEEKIMDKCYGIIYKATNKINGKMYIGQTIHSLDKRMRAHISKTLNNGDDFYFHKAIRKYSQENFTWKIIVECYSKKELNKVEIETIKEYNTFKSGYNLTLGGNGNGGFKHSEKTKKKISVARKGKYGKRGKDHPNFGKTHTEETKKKISEAEKGEKNHMYGKRGNKSPKAKKYIITTPEGEEIFIHGLRNFCKNYKKEKLRHQNLSRVAKGKLKYSKGYKCRYWEEKICNTI